MDNLTARKRRTCDIVMKGGITSGVVYPKAIARLATRFTFKNIGGTSAGAIAAAAAAAAEYRRVQTDSDAGFKQIESLGCELASTSPGSAHTMLFSLFAPNSTTKRPFEVLTSVLSSKSSSAKIFFPLFKTVRLYFLAAILGFVPGFVLALISVYSSASPGLKFIWTSIGFLTAILGAILASILCLVYGFVTALPVNNYGLCNGMSDPGPQKQAGNEPLTLWLSGYLNRVANITGDKPLTFGDLWNPRANSNSSENREINLEMMTANLTHGRPYRLPFRYDDDLKENHLFYFRKDEFDLLFPESVVNWMMNNPRSIQPGSDPDGTRKLEREKRAANGYFPLPNPAEFPVVVATRMSLSFPVLLSAIPLHSIDRSREPENQKLERGWFTDGGACSNFPLHFFDSPLPRRPTFSIDLTSKPTGTPIENLRPEMDEQNTFDLFDRWNRFDLNVPPDETKEPSEKGNLGKLIGFAGTLISTMQNWNDATQSRLPGFRDRVVRIPLTPELGGLNLNMPPKSVAFLGDQGLQSADMLIERFDVPAVEEIMTWENHRWIRVRTMFAAFEKTIAETLTACDHPENDDLDYGTWLQQLSSDETGNYRDLSYEPTKAQIDAAVKTIAMMREVSETWRVAGTAAKGSPRPRASMRPRAQV